MKLHIVCARCVQISLLNMTIKIPISFTNEYIMVRVFAQNQLRNKRTLLHCIEQTEIRVFVYHRMVCSLSRANA